MNFLKTKNNLFRNEEKKTRRNFVRNSLAGLFGISLLSKASDLFSKESKTEYSYLTRSGEIINNYNPQGSDCFLGEINIFPLDFTPVNYVDCNGALLNISENEALFSLLNTTYGGDGKTTFAVPDLRGKFPIQVGTGNNLTNRTLGESGGAYSVTLTANQLPTHTHTLNGSTDIGDTQSPWQGVMASLTDDSRYNLTSDTALNNVSTSNAGGSDPIDLGQPFFAVRFCIAVTGVYPQHPKN